jgi:uncharacterized protein (TIGR02118 family)
MRTKLPRRAEVVIVRMTQWQPRPGLAREEALRAWERHADLVERVPGLRRYVQNHAVAPPDGSDSPFAGLGEAWFDDAESARSALESPEWAAVIEDAKTFVDFNSVVATWAEPLVVREP